MPNPDNERMKRHYRHYLCNAGRASEATVLAALHAIARFEAYTRLRNFNEVNIDQAIAFRNALTKMPIGRHGKPLSASTQVETLRHLRGFFIWLSYQPGYRRKANRDHADYFNATRETVRKAGARMPTTGPSIDQVRRVVAAVEGDGAVARRNRAVIAFILLTGIRDGAVIGLKLRHLDMENETVVQDPREIHTKFSKMQITNFFPVGDDFRAVVSSWVDYLVEELVFGQDDPLFPAGGIALDECGQFVGGVLSRTHWQNAGPVRKIFKEAYRAAGMEYFSPHRLRNTLALLGQTVCSTPEQLKAWSQNLGHANIATTLQVYAHVDESRQQQILRSLRFREGRKDIHRRRRSFAVCRKSKEPKLP